MNKGRLGLSPSPAGALAWLEDLDQWGIKNACNSIHPRYAALNEDEVGLLLFSIPDNNMNN